MTDIIAAITVVPSAASLFSSLLKIIRQKYTTCYVTEKPGSANSSVLGQSADTGRLVTAHNIYTHFLICLCGASAIVPSPWELAVTRDGTDLIPSIRPIPAQKKTKKMVARISEKTYIFWNWKCLYIKSFDLY